MPVHHVWRSPRKAGWRDPGYCAQYYPNANCQNYGPGNPVGDPGSYYRNNWRNGNAVMVPPRTFVTVGRVVTAKDTEPPVAVSGEI